MAKNSQEYWNERARQDKIKVIKTDFHFVGVDTPADLEAVNKAYKNGFNGPKA